MRLSVLPIALLAVFVPGQALGQMGPFRQWRASDGRMYTDGADELRLGVMCLADIEVSVVLSSDRHLRRGHTGDEITVVMAMDSAPSISAQWSLELGTRYATLRAPDVLTHELLTGMLESKRLLVTLTVPEAGREVQLPVDMETFPIALRRVPCARGIYW